MRLTDTICKKTKPSNKIKKLFDGEGLYLEITPTGGKYWKLKYRFLEKERKLALGDYPLISLKDAREKRNEARKLLDKGIDPSFAKQEAKRQSLLDATNTFEAIAKEWHDTVKGKWSENHASTILSRMEMHIFPRIGHLSMKAITPPILLNALRQVENGGVYETTKRLRQYCGQVFRYAVATGRAERDVSVDIIGAFMHVKVKHHAALDIKELPEFLDKLNRNDARLFLQTRMAIELMLLTFVRTSELLEAKWEEFALDKKVWVIPAERMKMRKSHIVPLSKQVLQILHRLKAMNEQWQYILPSPTVPRKPMSENTVLYALYRMGYKGKATGHGFRALAMTAIKENLGYRHEVVDRQLAHAHRNSVDAAYDRAQFLEDRKKMMQEWADYIDTVRKANREL
jgi:integrase